jgi:AcrR family transcriptional regulator
MTETPSKPIAPEPTDAQDVELSQFAVRGRLRIRAHAARLFNDGLAAARNGRPDLARDFFAACVFWYPHDHEARSALALACLESGDRDTAREHWQQVLDRHPADQKARRGLDSLAAPAGPTAPPA